MKKLWWYKKHWADIYVPIFSGATLPITRKHDFPDIFTGDFGEKKFDRDEWLACREQLWAIKEGLVKP